jgi:anti-sigma factor RsiW
MACTRYITSIQELVDGSLGPIRRAELDLHLEACADCRALLTDLERIRDASAALDEVPVPDRTWLQLAGRLRQEGRISDSVTPVTRQSRAGRTAIVALAAALIVAVGASLLLLRPATKTAAPAAPAGPGNAVDQKSVEAVQNEVDHAQQQLETAIAHMEEIAKASQQTLDPKTAATLEKNRGVIDQAIAETRAAVKSDPGSVAARTALFDALRQKVTLLQDTIALINEMRKGNNAGAAQIVDGVNKS